MITFLLNDEGFHHPSPRGLNWNRLQGKKQVALMKIPMLLLPPHGQHKGDTVWILLDQEVLLPTCPVHSKTFEAIEVAETYNV